MKKLIVLFISFLLLWTIDYGLSTTHAAVPHLINYQGRLTDTEGRPLEGTYNLNFKIYDAENAGSLLWEETHAAVVVQKGIFSIQLGSVTALNLPFDAPYFLEISVNGQPMGARQKFTSSGYALRAENADNAAQATNAETAQSALDSAKLNGQDAAYYRNVSNIDAGVLSILRGGTGRTFHLISERAVGTTDILPPTTETDMPDMTVTLPTYGNKLLCMFTAPIYAYYVANNYSVSAKLYIDGVEKAKTVVGDRLTASGSTWWDNLTLIWLETGLTPGNHTVKIRWRSSVSFQIYQRGATDGARVLTVIDLD